MTLRSPQEMMAAVSDSIKERPQQAAGRKGSAASALPAPVGPDQRAQMVEPEDKPETIC